MDFENIEEKVSQDETGENGNNVSSPPIANQLYKYDFTLNNYTEVEVSQVKATIRKYAKKGGFGKEVGENGTPHLQGYISLIRKNRITAIHKWPGFARASFRAIRNDAAAQAYIQKDGDTWTYGFPKPVKVIEELYPWQASIRDIAITEADDRTIHWYWEEKGNIGKSAFIKYMIVKHQVLLCCGGKYSDIVNLVFNQDMNETQAVFFDIPRANKGSVSYAALESIKNGMVCNTKYETGVKVFNSPHVFVFANFPPMDLDALSSDRWDVQYLGDERLKSADFALRAPLSDLDSHEAPLGLPAGKMDQSVSWSDFLNE